jgi:hypothetical protein
VFLDSYKILWYLTGSKFKQSKRGRYFLGSTNSEPNQEVLACLKGLENPQYLQDRGEAAMEGH